MASSKHLPTTSIFLDASARRKWYFRIGTVACVVFLFGSLIVFLFGLSFFSSKNAPLTYADAILRYHYYYSAANNKKIALTFDDGPNPPASEMIMDELSKNGTPATFFYIGKSTLLRPDIAQEATNRGFDVEDHSFTHSQQVDSSYSRMAYELDTTGFLLSNITNKKPTIYRPPYLLGIGVDPTINPYIPVSPDMQWALQFGYLPVGSDLDTKDWLAKNPQDVVDGLATAMQDVPNGHIVLLHDDPNTAKAIDSIVAYLHNEGYTIVPLKDLLTPPTVLSLGATMRLGDSDLTTGGDVSKLQWFLYTQKYLDPYALSGVYDSATQTAVLNFQTHNSLLNSSNPNPETVGVAGPATRALMHAISVSAQPSVQVVPPLTGWALALSILLNGARAVILAAYINLFPVVRGILEAVISTTLLLVVARSLALVTLLLVRYFRGPSCLPEGDAPTGASILIPAYNEKENIGATVESIIGSTYYPREIIVIDDGSTDSTPDEVRKVVAAFPNEGVRLITIPNGGKAHALNIGIASSQYGVIVVLDADAVLDSGAVSKFMPHFADPLVGAVAGKVRTTDSSHFLDISQTLEYAIGQNIDKTAFSTIGAVGVVPGPAGAWRKAFLEEAGGFHTDTLVEDQEMTLTMLHMGKKVIYEEGAIAYTETPHTIKNFLKQRFRWVYGTMQAFWKHKSIMWERPDSVMSLVVMSNIFVYNILLPLTYPFADSALVFGLLFGEWQTLVLPFVIFTILDLLYATWGLRGEPNRWKLMMAVPLQRVVYRQLLYYTVYKSFIRAIEGSGTVWNKFAKIGETKRFYMSALTSAPNVEVLPIEELPQPLQTQVQEVLASLQPIESPLQPGRGDMMHEVMSLSTLPEESSLTASHPYEI
jgi:cellulose synthase/poly-beta-1,6-N-acetylglucosamine synthase-like glycosyltransferase/peptidoglycan/xylan/chitin deacetylase (PgdA/CDA1 family)